jgi:hypothetical protein
MTLGVPEFSKQKREQKNLKATSPLVFKSNACFAFDAIHLSQAIEAVQSS